MVHPTLRRIAARIIGMTCRNDMEGVSEKQVSRKPWVVIGALQAIECTGTRPSVGGVEREREKAQGRGDQEQWARGRLEGA